MFQLLGKESLEKMTGFSGKEIRNATRSTGCSLHVLQFAGGEGSVQQPEVQLLALGTLQNEQ